MLDVLVPAKRLTFYWRTIKRLMSDVFLELWLCGVKSWPPDWPSKMLEQHTKRSWCQWPNSVAAMSCLWTFGFWAIWEWVGAVKFESPKSNGVAYVFPIWYHSLTHQESQAQTHAGISAFNIDLWVDWSPTFLPHSAGIWWSFEGWIWWSFPGPGSKTPMDFILLEGTNVGLLKMENMKMGATKITPWLWKKNLTRICLLFNVDTYQYPDNLKWTCIFPPNWYHFLCFCVATSCLVRILQTDHPRRNLDIWPPAARNVMWIHWSYFLRGSISNVGCLAKIHSDFHLGFC